MSDEPDHSNDPLDRPRPNLDDIPVVQRVGSEGSEGPEPPPIPSVLSAEPVGDRRPLPAFGFWQGILICVAFLAVLYGTMTALGLGYYLFEVVLSGNFQGVIDREMEQLKTAGEAAAAQRNFSLPEVMGRSIVVAMCGSQYLMFLLLLLSMRRLVGRDWRRQLAVRRPPIAHVMLALAGIPAFMIVSESIGKVVFRVFGTTPDPAQAMMLKELFGQFPWWFAVLTVGLAPGLLEEFWCRGFLGRALVRRFGWIDGVIFTSMLFGFLHLFPPAYVVTVTFMGVMLHYTYAVSRSIWVSVIVHALNNSVAILGATGQLPVEQLEANAQANALPVIFLSFVLLGTVGLTMWTIRARCVPAEGGAVIPPLETSVALPKAGSGTVIVDRLPSVFLVLPIVLMLVTLGWLLG